MMADLAETQKEIAKREEHEKHERFIKPSFIVSNALFLLTLLAIYLPADTMVEIVRTITFGAVDAPGGTVPASSIEFYVAVLISWGLFMWRYIAGGKKRSTCNIASVVFLFFLIWEVLSTDLKITHPVLIPLPENVFAVFTRIPGELWQNVYTSLTLLAQGFLTSLVAATVIGGTSLAGGSGKLWGTMLGVLLLGMVNTGLDLLNVNSFYQQVAKGLIILGAVMLDSKRGT